MDTSPAQTHRPSRRTRRLGIAAAVALALLLVVPMLWPVPPLTGLVQPRELADPDSGFAEVDGVEYHYKIAGDAGASCNIVLLHGFGASVFSWRDTLPSLGERCRVLAYDRPGFGLTSRPLPGEWTGPNPYSASAQADAVVRLMDRFGMQRAVLVGHSAGAVVAVLAAQRYPDRVAGLVLEDPALLSPGGPPGWITPLLRTPQARRIGPALVRRIAGPGSDDFIRSAYSDESILTPAVLAGYRKPLQARDWDRGLWEVTAAPRPADLTDILRDLDVPALVVYGQKDSIVAPADSIAVSELLPLAKVTGLPNAGHLPHEELPAAFETLVFRFLDDLEAAGVP